MGSYASSYNEDKALRMAFEEISGWCMQICTHPGFGRLIIASVYAPPRSTTCVLAASNAARSDVRAWEMTNRVRIALRR